MSSLAIRVITAFLTQANDPKLTPTTVWEHPPSAHQINHRYSECLLNDESCDLWGIEMSRQFKLDWENARRAHHIHGQPRANMSCRLIADTSLGSFESAHFMTRGHFVEPGTLPPSAASATPKSPLQLSHKTGAGSRARRDARRAAGDARETETHFPAHAYMPDHLSE